MHPDELMGSSGYLVLLASFVYKLARFSQCLRIFWRRVGIGIAGGVKEGVPIASRERRDS
jgi:hypothetical protein